jgi:hypothetical protein
MVQGESGAGYDQLHGFNTGLMYVRGAAPDGPTAWLLAETILRWASGLCDGAGP